MIKLKSDYPDDPEAVAAGWYRQRGLGWAAEMIEQGVFIPKSVTAPK
jgi:hypothetical protein